MINSIKLFFKQVRVVVNMFSGITTGGFNPMMLVLANNEDMDIKDLMMMQMMGGQNPMMGFMNSTSTEKK